MSLYYFCWNCAAVENRKNLRLMRLSKDSKQRVLICNECQVKELLK